VRHSFTTGEQRAQAGLVSGSSSNSSSSGSNGSWCSLPEHCHGTCQTHSELQQPRASIPALAAVAYGSLKSGLFRERSVSTMWYQQQLLVSWWVSSSTTCRDILQCFGHGAAARWLQSPLGLQRIAQRSRVNAALQQSSGYACSVQLSPHPMVSSCKASVPFAAVSS
jgi:hypothetical protein